MAATLLPMACGALSFRVWTPSALSQLMCCVGAATGAACMEIAYNLELVMRCPFQQFAHSYQGVSRIHTADPRDRSQQVCVLKGVKPDATPCGL